MYLVFKCKKIFNAKLWLQSVLSVEVSHTCLKKRRTTPLTARCLIKALKGLLDYAIKIAATWVACMKCYASNTDHFF